MEIAHRYYILMYVLAKLLHARLCQPMALAPPSLQAARLTTQALESRKRVGSSPSDTFASNHLVPDLPGGNDCTKIGFPSGPAYRLVCPSPYNVSRPPWTRAGSR